MKVHKTDQTLIEYYLMANDRISSLLGDESEKGVESIYSQEIFTPFSSPESLAVSVVSDGIDRHIAAIEDSIQDYESGASTDPRAQTLSVEDAKMDIEDYKLIQEFMHGRTTKQPFDYYARPGHVRAKAVEPEHLHGSTLQLGEEHSVLSPVKQVSVGVTFPESNRFAAPEKHISRPQYTIDIRVEDAFRAPNSRRTFYQPRVGMAVQVYGDNSLRTVATKYIGEVSHYANDTALSYPMDHPLAKKFHDYVKSLDIKR